MCWCYIVILVIIILCLLCADICTYVYIVYTVYSILIVINILQLLIESSVFIIPVLSVISSCIIVSVYSETVTAYLGCFNTWQSLIIIAVCLCYVWKRCCILLALSIFRYYSACCTINIRICIYIAITLGTFLCQISRNIIITL